MFFGFLIFHANQNQNWVRKLFQNVYKCCSECVFECGLPFVREHSRSRSAWLKHAIPPFEIIIFHRVVDLQRILLRLQVSSFNSAALSTDNVYVIRDVTGQIQSGKGLKAEVLTSVLLWPNEVGAVPGEFAQYAFVDINFFCNRYFTYYMSIEFHWLTIMFMGEN